MLPPWWRVRWYVETLLWQFRYRSPDFGPECSTLNSQYSLPAKRRKASVPAALRPPQALRGESCPLDQRLELGPHDGRMLALVHRPLGKPTVGPGHDSLPAHHAREVDNSLRHCLGMLDHCSGVRDDAGNEHLARGQLEVFPHAPLIRMTGRRRLHRVGLGLDPAQEVHDVAQAEV